MTNAFGPPVCLEGPDPIEDQITVVDGSPASFQDSAGRIHVAWSSTYGGGRLRYTVSGPGGGPFSAPASPPPAKAPATAPSVGGLHVAKSVLVPGQATVFRFRSSRPGLAVLSFEKRFRGG